MKIEAVASQVTSRQYVNQKGVQSTYYDAFFLDAEADPMKRFPGQIQTKPTEEEIKRLSIAEGSKFTLHIMQIQEVRNGVPICVVKYEAASKPKAA
ncbi:MAG: hypothetical protein V4599_01775 [Verrucomicrobiota bacterium]